MLDFPKYFIYKGFKQLKVTFVVTQGHWHWRHCVISYCSYIFILYCLQHTITCL